MGNGTPHNGGPGWPPPSARYVMRTTAFAASSGAAGAAFSGHPGAAGILAVIAAALQLVDVIGGK